MRENKNGYSVVEVMITLFVASVFLLAFYQIYNITRNVSQQSLERAYAVNMAARFIDEAKYYAGTENRDFDSDNPVGPVQPPTIADIVRVQSAIANPGSGGANNVSRSFPSGVSQGNLLVVAVTWGDNRTLNSCTDTRGNVYSIAVQRNDSANSQSAAICYTVSGSAGSNTVTANFSGSATYRRIVVAEYSGAASVLPLDVAAGQNISGSSGSSNSLTSGTEVTSQNKTLITGATINNINATSVSAGTGFSQVQSNDFFYEDRIQPTAGSVAATMTPTNSNRHTVVMAAFKPATIAPPPSEPVEIPYKNQPGARGEYRVIITTENITATLQKYNVEVQYGPDGDRKSINLSAYIRYGDGLYYGSNTLDSGAPDSPENVAGTNGGPLSSVVSTAAPPASSSSSVITHGDYVYLIGGASSNARLTRVLYARINSDGSITSWQNATSLPNTRSEGAVAIVNGKIYYTGGSSNSQSVLYASINSDGSIGSWTSVNTNLFTNLYGHSMVSRNGMLYVIGGFYNFSTENNRISRVTVGGDGTLGSWTHQTSWFSNAAHSSQQSSLIYGDRLYVAGKGSMRRATFGADGAVNSPTISTLPIANKYPNHGLAQMNGTFYLVGGHTGGFPYNAEDDVYYSRVASDGEPGAWTVQNNLLPAPRTYTAVVTKNNRIYIINGATYEDDFSSVFVGTSD